MLPHLRRGWVAAASITQRGDVSEEVIQNALKVALDTGTAGISDKITFVAGLPLNGPHMVNTVRVLILGTVLARSSAGGYANLKIWRAQGRIVHASTPEEARSRIISAGGDILVCRVLTDDYTPILRIVSGVICEGVSEISEQRLRDINPRLVWLTHIRCATQKLESGLTVTLDAKQLFVYEGSV